MKKKIVIGKILISIRTHYWNKKIDSMIGKTVFLDNYNKACAAEFTVTHFTLYFGWR